MKFTAILAFALLLSSGAWAKTLYVEKDGTGDFVSPQEAAEVAADGDTIRIGAGRFEDFVVETPGGIVVAIMAPQVSRMTIIGAGTGFTFFGPAEIEGSEPLQGSTGVLSTDRLNSDDISIAGITFENLHIGVLAQRGSQAIIRNCHFLGCGGGAMMDKHNLIVEDCHFTGRGGWSLDFLFTYVGSDVDTFVMRRCFYDGENCNNHSDAVDMITNDSFLMEDCVISGTKYRAMGMNGYGDGTYTIRNCEFSTEHEYYPSGIIVYDHYIGSPTFQFEDCQFTGYYVAIEDRTAGRVRYECEGLVTRDISAHSIQYEHTIAGYIHNSIFDAGANGVICPRPGTKMKSRDFLPGMAIDENLQVDTSDSLSGVSEDRTILEFDMTRNWWGTSDPDSIQVLIVDGLDDPIRPLRVLWDPYLHEVVPAEKKTLGGVRSLYR